MSPSHPTHEMNYNNILPRNLRHSHPLSSMAARLLHYLFLPEKKNITDDACRHLLKFPCINFSQPPPPPPPLSGHGSSVSPILIILIAVLSSCFLLVSYYAVIVKFCSRWRSPGAAIAEDGLQESDAGLSDHDSVSPANFIWYINTVGLEESVITSITMCKYRRGEGLVDGTDCSVCLTEFRENDDLRLLPKCGHAFHVPCIDTWLTSHVNCPLCRAPIVVTVDVEPAPASPQASSTENSHNIVTVGLSPNSATDGQSSLGTGEYGRRGLDLEAALSRVPSSRGYYRMRVLSDLGDNHRLDEVMRGEDVQQVRRSVSMDSSAGSMAGLSVADLLSVAMEQLHEGQTRPSAGECSEESMRSGHSPKHYGGCRRWNKLSSKRSWGSCMLSRPIAMKRSYSTGGRLLLPRHSRSRNSSSVLPL